MTQLHIEKLAIQISSVTPIQVMAPCSATGAQAAAQVPQMVTATRTAYGQAAR